MNVVEQWRNRGRALGGAYLVCTHCGRVSAVRRVLCSGCRKPTTDAKRALLPRRLKAVGASHRHAIVETFDQVGTRGTVMLTRANEGLLLAFLLAESDVPHAGALVGETLDLVLRRNGTEFGPHDPIVYTRKLAANLETRLKLLKKNSKPEG